MATKKTPIPVSAVLPLTDSSTVAQMSASILVG